MFVVMLHFVFQCLCSQRSMVKLSKHFHSIISFCLAVFVWLLLFCFDNLLGTFDVAASFFFILYFREGQY